MITLGQALSLNGAAGRAVTNGPSTPHQRLYARTLMRQLDLDTRFFAAGHDRFFLQAKLIRPERGADVDAHLCGLTRSQISALLQALKAEVCDE